MKQNKRLLKSLPHALEVSLAMLEYLLSEPMKMSAITYKQIPVLGQIAAGKPVEYLKNVRWRDCRLPSWATDKDDFVYCEVCGDSLEPYAHDGDFALILLTHKMRQGTLAAVLTPEGMALKLWYVMGSRVMLKSYNSAFKVRYYEAEDVQLQGRVVRTEHDW